MFRPFDFAAEEPQLEVARQVAGAVWDEKTIIHWELAAFLKFLENSPEGPILIYGTGSSYVSQGFGRIKTSSIMIRIEMNGDAFVLLSIDVQLASSRLNRACP